MRKVLVTNPNPVFYFIPEAKKLGKKLKLKPVKKSDNLRFEVFPLIKIPKKQSHLKSYH